MAWTNLHYIHLPRCDLINLPRLSAARKAKSENLKCAVRYVFCAVHVDLISGQPLASCCYCYIPVKFMMHVSVPTELPLTNVVKHSYWVLRKTAK